MSQLPLARAPRPQRTRRVGRSLSIVPVAASCLAALTLVGCGTARSGSAARVLAPAGASTGLAALPQTFGWPIRPFHREHPLRATFGEPRAVIYLGLPLLGAARAEALNRMDQVALAGRRSLHNGVDIVARDGTPVSAVTSGVAITAGAGYERHVTVGPFQYWHLASTVPTGTRVVAFRTVIGRVYPAQHHVHMTRLALDGNPLNPLIDGGLTPYSDTAPPRLGHLIAYRPDGTTIPLGALTGPVVLAVNSFDVQSFGGLETGLYRLDWSVRLVGARHSAVGPLELFRFDQLPPDAVGERLYTLGSTRHATHPHFWYRLTTEPPDAHRLLRGDLLHTERMPPGRYRLVVTAWDVRGNRVRRGYLLDVVHGPAFNGATPFGRSVPG